MKQPPVLSSAAPLYLCVLDQPNLNPYEDGDFELRNFGAPPIGTLYIDANPGELSKPVMHLQKQNTPPELIRGVPPDATYIAEMKVYKVPVPRSLLEIIKKMNEGQFLELSLNDKGVILVPLSRRVGVLQYLGFDVK